ncbi:MAG: hypothetical protein LBQ14_07940 [Treponema sp.]|jgi:hypothetical protein|nr:hypothetical protein [Treponema sp.]
MIIGAAIAGAAIGGISSIIGLVSKNKQAQQQKDLAWDQYLAGKEYSDQQYAIQKQNAAEDLALQRYRLNQSLDASVDQFNTGLLGQAYGIQQAQIQTASSIGSSLAAEGAGGTRGNAANSLMRAYEERSLERNIQLQNEQNSQAIGSLASQATHASQDINRERASWNEGGYRYELKQAQDAYNLQMAELGQSNFDWNIGQISANAPLDILGGIFGGASSGMKLGGSISQFNNLGGWSS